MKITAIQEQQKHKDRLNVMVDGAFGFGVHMDVLLDFRLKIGMELTEAKVIEIKTADAFRQAYDKALNYLAGRPHSVQEMRQYLRNKLIYKHPDYADMSGEATQSFGDEQETAIEQIVQKLIEARYVDDAAFAKWWIGNRQQFRPRGKRLLLLELKAKGVSDADIAKALTTPNEEGHFSGEAVNERLLPNTQDLTEGFDEVGSALKLAQKQQRKYAGLEDGEFRQKMGRYLISKGFDWETVEIVVKKLKEERA